MTPLTGAFVVLCLTSLASAVANGYNKHSGSLFVLSVGDNLLDSRDTTPGNSLTDLEQIENALLLPNLQKCSYDNVIFVEVPKLQPRELYLYDRLDDVSNKTTVDTAIAPYVFKKHDFRSLVRTTVKDTCVSLKDADNNKKPIKAPKINTVSLPKSREPVLVAQQIERIARDAAARVDETTLLIVRSVFRDSDSSDDGDSSPSSSAPAESSSSSEPVKREANSVFDKYTFFTPGLFSGLIVTWLLLLILTVGLSWTSNLQVSYKAFEPERKSL